MLKYFFKSILIWARANFLIDNRCYEGDVLFKNVPTPQDVYLYASFNSNDFILVCFLFFHFYQRNILRKRKIYFSITVKTNPIHFLCLSIMQRPCSALHPWRFYGFQARQEGSGLQFVGPRLALVHLIQYF